MGAFLGRPLLSSELGLEVPVDLTVERTSEIGYLIEVLLVYCLKARTETA